MKRLVAKSPRSKLERQMEELEARNFKLAHTLQIIEEERACFADHYDFAPIGFVTLDANGCIREMNLTAARLTGHERSYLLARPFLGCVAKPGSRLFLHHLRQCKREKTEVINQLELSVKGGRTLPVELRSVPVLDPRRGDTVYRTAITDITERLRAGRDLRESEDRYRTMVELSPDGVFILVGGTIVFANRAALQLSGAESAGDLLGRRIIDFVRPTFMRGVLEEMFQGASAAKQTPVEMKFLRFDSTKVDVEVLSGDFTYAGERAVLVLARNIARRRRAEQQVLEISEREKVRFGQDLHDGLCQSLTGAAFLAEALRNQLRADGSQAVQDADNVAAIIRECIEESRTLAKGLYPVSVEKHGFVTALHQLASDVTGRGAINCKVECDDSLVIHDAGVATNLYRITQEALTNAIKHGAAKSMLIRLAVNNGKTTLTLRDDGKGFPMKPKETGIGLFTMRYRAAMIGGSLEIQRDGEGGTVVTCSFPTNK